LPPFAQTGTKIDVTAATVGDAANLQGGLLIMTPLRAPDGQVYAVAQGSVVTGGFVAGRGQHAGAESPDGGTVPGGAIVERTPPTEELSASIHLQLHRADFTTAARIAEAINRRYPVEGGRIARAENAARIAVAIPSGYAERGWNFWRKWSRSPWRRTLRRGL
jgi:flagellar P-ring protein FlgI